MKNKKKIKDCEPYRNHKWIPISMLGEICQKCGCVEEDGSSYGKDEDAICYVINSMAKDNNKYLNKRDRRKVWEVLDKVYGIREKEMCYFIK